VSAGKVDLGFLAGQRVRHAIAAALEAMPEDVKAERIAWCQRTGQHGVTAYRSDVGVDLQWAGQRLAFIEADALTEDSLLFHGLDASEVDPS